MSNAIRISAALVAIAFVFGAIVWIEHRVWRECRDDGKSVIYCMRMLAR